MSGRRITSNPSHCKAMAQRLQRDAEQIAARLAKGETTIKALSVEYDCNQVTLRKHLTAVIGAKRWRQLIYHRGPQPGTFFGRPRGLKEEKIEETGPHCWYCGKTLTPDTRVCGYCGTLQ